jgi:photosystem II stability/assembly factor-like uncharacterized protein
VIAARLASLILLLTAALLVAGDAAAAARWEPSNGPEGGGVSAVAVAASAPDVLYVGTGRGVFRSLDGGRSWTGAGLVQPPGPFGSSPPGVTALLVDPRAPTTVYAGLGGRWVGGTTYSRPVFKSTNGGRTWRTLPLRGQPIAISPTQPSTVYAATGGPGGTSRVVRSTDGGRSWRTADGGLPSTYLWAFAFDPTAPATVYAAMGPQGLFASGDGGGSWRRLGVPPAYGEVTAVAVDGQDPRTLYAGTDAGVIKSLDGGRSWRIANAAMGGHRRDRWYGQVSALVVDPRHSRTLYATAICTGVFKSTDGGHRWSQAHAGLEPKCGRAFALALDPGAPQRIYVADSSRGVFESLDGGTRWHAANAGLSLSTIFALAAGPQRPGTVYAAAGGLGLFESSDGGTHWQSLARGIELVDGVTLDPSNPDNVLAVVPGYGVVRSSDAGRTWVQAPLGTRYVHAVAISGRVAYAGGRSLFGSTDGGRSWRELRLLGALGAIDVRALAVAPEDAAVYAGIADFGASSAGGLYKSTDSGNSWTRLGALHADVGAIALDPADAATIYVAGGGGVFRSSDGGTSWQPVNSGLPRRRFKRRDNGKWTTYTDGVTALAIDPAHPTTLYAAAFERGVFRSTDSGRSWQPLNAGLPVLDVLALALDPTDKILYAGTSGGGVVSLYPAR